MNRRQNLPPGPGPGRPKGMPNKLNADLRQMVLDALEKAGGVDYLAGQAQCNPVAFLSLLAKLLPNKITGDVAEPIAIQSNQYDGASRVVDSILRRLQVGHVVDHPQQSVPAA